jgi:hypothetical protein
VQVAAPAVLEVVVVEMVVLVVLVVPMVVLVVLVVLVVQEEVAKKTRHRSRSHTSRRRMQPVFAGVAALRS